MVEHSNQAHTVNYFLIVMYPMALSAQLLFYNQYKFCQLASTYGRELTSRVHKHGLESCLPARESIPPYLMNYAH